MDVNRPDPVAGAGGDDPESADAAEVDLRPRDLPPARRRRWPAAAALVVLLVALGIVLMRGLGDATLFFYNADEAVENRERLGDDRFRLQGTVVPGSVEGTGDTVAFAVTYNDVSVDVRHRGDPPELFQEGIPVVVEGRWVTEGHVASDRIMVKHTEIYEEEHSDRIDDAERGGSEGDAPGGQGSEPAP